MDDDERLLARLGRIDALSRDRSTGGASSQDLLRELRRLVREAEERAEARTATEGASGREEVVERLRTALARDIIGM